MVYGVIESWLTLLASVTFEAVHLSSSQQVVSVKWSGGVKGVETF